MRFLDTNVLVYALLAPRSRVLSVQEKVLLSNAKAIMRRIENGEPALCSVVHLSEFVNIVQRRADVGSACDALAALLALPSLKVALVKPAHYDLAIELARHETVGINDSLAFVLMAEHEVSEVYSFDADFDRLHIERVIR